MKINIVFDVEHFDDGTNWRYSGNFSVNDHKVNVPAGTTDLEDMVVAEIADQLGRELTDDEVETMSDDIYSMVDFEATFPETATT